MFSVAIFKCNKGSLSRILISIKSNEYLQSRAVNNELITGELRTNKTMAKQRLWVLPWGLYPRQVTIYLKEKGIFDKFNVIPVNITTNGMEEAPGKPPGSMPILEVDRPSADGKDSGHYILQSTAILEYLEDIYGPGPGTADMRGATPEERARVRDCMSVLNEAVEFFGAYCHKASKLFETMEEPSVEAAKVLLERTQQMLTLLESIAAKEGPWLAGKGGGPTIVDCVAMAFMQFAWYVYKFDVTEGHPRLKTLYDVFSKKESAEMEEVPQFVKDLAPNLSVR